MLAIPNSDFLQEALMGLSLGDDVPAFRAVSVEVLTSRGKSLGVTDMLLVDLPWTAASAFRQPVNFRAAKFKDADQIRPEVNGQAGRPSRDQILAAADAWVGSGMDEDTAQEYLEEAPDQQFSEPYAPSEPRPAPADYQQLVKRVAELESRLTAVQQVPAAPPRSAAKAPPLFGAQTSPLDADQWNRIQKLAGSSAPRVGSVETRRSGSCCNRLPRSCASDFGKGSRRGCVASRLESACGLGVRPSLADPSSSTAAEPVVDAATVTETTRSSPRHSGQLGQRKRQWLQCQGLSGPRSFPADYSRSAAGCNASPDECHEGAGLWTRPGGFFTHAAVCGTPDSFAGVAFCPWLLQCWPRVGRLVTMLKTSC